MIFFARFRAIEEKDKAAVVRKLMQSSTLNFDFLYLTGLSVLMATFGMLADSPAIVIGSMLIAPLLYPILGVALGLVMSNGEVLSRSLITLTKAVVVGVLLSVIATLFFGDGLITNEIMARTEASLIHFLVAMVAGAAVSFALAQPEWSETLPGIAISVALIPPLSVVGIGIAMFDMTIIAGSVEMLLVNLFGIVFAAMVSFSLMNLYEKQNIAASTIKRADEEHQKEEEAVAEMSNGLKGDSDNQNEHNETDDHDKPTT
jgi:uncharacterized hydrophobic protein (TIGR00271 family)